MRVYLIIVCLLTSMNTVYAAEKKTRSNVLVLDTSNNMRSQIEGRAKLDLVKMALADFTQLWPKGEKLAILSYRSHSDRECQRINSLSQTSKALNKGQFEQLSQQEMHNTIFRYFLHYIVPKISWIISKVISF